jgi:hypothetical protein
MLEPKPPPEESPKQYRMLALRWVLIQRKGENSTFFGRQRTSTSSHNRVKAWILTGGLGLHPPLSLRYRSPRLTPYLPPVLTASCASLRRISRDSMHQLPDAGIPEMGSAVGKSKTRQSIIPCSFSAPCDPPKVTLPALP